MDIKRPESKQPIPDNAKCVFKGVMFDVYQWKQLMYDGTIETFEKITRPDTVVILPVLDSGEIVLTKQEQPGKKPFIGTVGGKINPDESVIEAAKRELLEETGYEANSFELWESFQSTGKIDWAIYVLIAKGLVKVSDQTLDPGEKIDLYPLSFNEFIDESFNGDFFGRNVYKHIAEAKVYKHKYKELKSLFSIK